MPTTMRIIIGLVLLHSMITGCQSKFIHEIQKNDNSVTILGDSVTIKLEIIDESIIHVQKSLKGDRAEGLPNYVTVLEPQNVAWELKQSNEQLVISTAKLNVVVNSDGTIEYKNIDGESLLSETNELTYITSKPEGRNMVSQAFVAQDEALYGLGQYQSGIMNWKNVPVRLEQFNQEVAIPFLVSTKNYGIYWNNYSITDFNPAQHEIAFPESTTETQSGVVEKVDMDVENVIKHKTTANQEKNIRETTFIPEKTGMYTFFVESDKLNRMKGEIRVTIDRDTIIDYSTIWVPTCFSGRKELEAGKEYKVVFQNTGAAMAGSLHYNEPDFNKTVFSSEVGSVIDYYFMHGSTPAEVLALNHKLTGQTPLFNKKAYGFWQCRERYHTQAELLENAREMRKRNIPVDYIIQDWFYWPEGTKGPEWDRAKYPDPKAMADELHDLNMLLMVSVWPQVNNDPLLKKYDLLQYKLGEKNHNLDFFNEGVRERYYKMLSDSMFQFGVNSIWLDGTEPAGRPNLDQATAVGSFRAVNNIYSLVVTKAMYEGKEKEYPNERILNLNRSAFTGQQRYGSVTWSGDVASTWEQFAEQISAGLNFTMAGLPYWSHDIGGFFRDSNSMNPVFDNQYTNNEFVELLARWFQFGAFSPVFRIHGYVSETEIWRYGQAFEDMARKFIDLRYKLMPYIYSEAWKINQQGHVLMSPLAYYYPTDKNTWEIKDQLFFGESIMVGLVTEYQQREKEIYLPQGEWFNFWTEQKASGGTTVTVEAPFDSTPVFVKAGSIIPTGPKIQYATQASAEPLRIKIYPGKDAEYTLYFDDNETRDYEKGEFSEVRFKYTETDQKVTVTKGNGTYLNFTEAPMDFTFELVGTGKTSDLSFNGDESVFNF
ncbi:TIM-barrel domain-containing protein [Mangrovibacterium sp.]|uniref:glycoside hydrolase family 31 protein n=1 Tax=Mangrovibacterium sp. TaxID=1961364 RepID=UPI0035675491